tara:strand:+ start:1051 stop:1347 length:297 start_codon:yes stop_codon:yes gene_type:complete
MRITFKEIRDGMANKIFLNGKFIGIVEVYSLARSWKMKPCFHHSYRGGSDIIYKKYDSFYDAGKALANLYQVTLNDDDEVATDEFDMRGVFKSIGYGP